MSQQFFRASTDLLHATDRQLGTVALKVTAAWLMAIPGYRAPHGGIKAQLRRYFRSGASFAAAWRSLNRNHLHLRRAPVGDNRFETFYHFSIAAVPSDGLLYLSAAEGRRQAVQHTQHREPVKGYMSAPVWLLKDSALSPAAKSVVLLALEELALARNVTGYTAAKQSMIARAGVPASSFEAAWREAKAAGYIQQERQLNPDTGLFTWAYSVAADLEEAKENAVAYADRQPVIRRRSADRCTVADAAPAAAASTVPERRAVRELVEKNISAAQLMEWVRTAPLYYTAEDIHSYVQLITDTVCCTLPTVRIGRQELPTQAVREAFLQLNSEHILYVMKSLQGTQDIRNPLAYKRTALYNAAVTYGEYALGVTRSA